MAWTIPDYGEGDSNIQSVLFQEYLDVLLAGIGGVDCVLSGLVVTGGADMTPAVAKGAVLSAGIMYAVAAADVTITTADATNPRLDLIVVTAAGALAVRAGTPAAAPKPPARTANDVVIAVVYVPANDTAIATSQISDMRVIRGGANVGRGAPIIVHKTTTAETTNNSAAAIHVLKPSSSGVSIPSGLFLAGQILRVRVGGNLLINSGTPTVTFIISYGGTTMFSDITAAWTADADRAAWFIDFQVTAQGTSDQALSGQFMLSPIAAKTAPTTGIGDVGSSACFVTPISGSAAVDSDAANRLLAVTITMSVANAANEIVVETATVELI